MSEQTVNLNWVFASIEDISEIKTGKLDANAASDNGDYPFFTCSEDASRISSYSFDTEAVLLAGNGFFNVKWFKGKFDAYQRTYVIEPRGVDGRFLYYLFLQLLPEITKKSRGSTIKYLRLGDIQDTRFFLPPRAEQTRIVAKLEELLSDLDAGVAELKAAQKKLGQYRQSLLKAAVEGALTAEWRAARTPLAPCGRGAGGEGYHGQAEALACSEPSCTVDTVSPSPQPLPHQEGGATTVDESWLQARARELRRAQTPQEQALWQHLRAKRFDGYKFRRQQPLGHYIVDFVCFGQKLIVELDGSQHANATQYDAQRDAWLKQQGFRVLRFWNNQWTAQPESVLEAIWLTLQQEPPLSSCPPLPNPSPSRGEGLETETGAALTPLSLDGIGAGGEGETGAQLLERILTERRARWEAKQLAKFVEQGKTPPKDWQKKYPEPVQPDTTDLPELPEGWVWASVEQIASDERYSLSIGPFGSNLKVPDYRDAGVPLVFVRNIRSGNYGGEHTKYVTPEKADELAAHSVAAGDVLVTKMGEPPGDADVYPNDQPPAIITADCIKIRCWPGLIEPEFLKTIINSHIGKRQIEPMTQGVAQKKVSLGRFTSFAVPVPPADEQALIVQTITAADHEALQQLQAINYSLKQSTAQRQNILRAAFAGQLVPQDPTDEPASVLLERIRAERAEQTANKKPRGRKAKESE